MKQPQRASSYNGDNLQGLGYTPKSGKSGVTPNNPEAESPNVYSGEGRTLGITSKPQGFTLKEVVGLKTQQELSRYSEEANKKNAETPSYKNVNW